MTNSCTYTTGFAGPCGRDAVGETDRCDLHGGKKYSRIDLPCGHYGGRCTLTGGCIYPAPLPVVDLHPSAQSLEEQIREIIEHPAIKLIVSTGKSKRLPDEDVAAILSAVKASLPKEKHVDYGDSYEDYAFEDGYNAAIFDMVERVGK